MADTIKEKIAQNVQTTLRGITGAPGYINTFASASVQRIEAGAGNLKAIVPYIIINELPEEYTDLGFITNCKMSMELYAVISAVTDTAAALNNLLGDIKKALMVDYRRGGYAEATRITGSIPFESAEGQPEVGLIISLEIVYRHKLGDPTSQ